MNTPYAPQILSNECRDKQSYHNSAPCRNIVTELKVVNPNHIYAVDMFLTTERLYEVLRTVNAYDSSILINFPETNYYILPETLRTIPQVINNKKFGKNLERMQI
ncbi:hypothetical protein BX616_001072 [Lobosporangium transversale]|nr:hypothetical protein BX616_001072 [Lobosporangium transversale]